ncbi:hypothetical protein EXU57_16080 [Segetibacter sp. 3557_3]|uniref:sensor histidine kinase n=1 Tax=Segetibacter sp. 3557_3 TaxID=2547429 RepID=UPI001058FB40|nr:two-component regulator propeller domain-containing protein [Segetibacter sp. 3557_3]TDH24006.1 hypothetical protein EXU57_16080 [Segetibacter sp. 3557_3]
MKCNGTYILLSILLFFTSLTIRGQVMGVKAYAITGDDFSPGIFSVVQHSAGYMLVGAADGLYRFDGNAFSRFAFTDTPKNKAVTAICEDRSHTVWLGFQSGEIARLERGSICFLNAEEGHPKVAINKIIQDRAGTLLFATAGEGVYYYTKSRFYNINTDDGLTDDYVYDIVLTPTSLLAGTDRGLNALLLPLSTKTIKAVTSAQGLRDNIVRCLYSDPGKNTPYWVGMQDFGLGRFTFRGGINQLSYPSHNWNFGQVNAILGTGDNIWAATDGYGIISVPNRRDSGAVRPSQITGLNYKKTANLFTDGEGNTWFSAQNQLVKTNGAQLQNILPQTANIHDQVHCLLVDEKENIWLNYNGGLKRFSLVNGSWVEKSFPIPQVNKRAEITCLYEDRFGHIWIGTMGKGIFLLDQMTGSLRQVNENALLNNGSILSIHGKDKEVWLSGLSGAISVLLTPENKSISSLLRFNRFPNKSQIGSNYVYSIMVDSKNRVWFATDGEGITVNEGGRYTNYNAKHGIKSPVVYSVCEDHKGNIWFSTLNAGVYKFDGSGFTNYNVEHGLNDPTITALAPDSYGNIVAISKKGMNIIEQSTGTIFSLDADQGINGINDDLNCIATTSNGKVLSSSASGILQYAPAYKRLQPKIFLENIQVFGESIDPDTKQPFSYDNNNFSFLFSGISYSHPSRVRYQYQLQGLSNQWVTTRDNKVNFPKLAPGYYTFRVRASINGNFENSQVALYSFSISRPYYLQLWFIALVVFAGVASIYRYIKLREKRLQRLDRLEKDRIQSQFETLKSQVNPHFLFNSFNTLIAVIEESPEHAVEYVEHLSDLYRKIVSYRDKDVITLAEELELIHDYFFIQHKRFGNNLRLDNQVTSEFAQTFMIAPLTLQLLAENAVKHNSISAGNPLTITIAITGDYLLMTNNLNPKITPEKGEQMGLQNIQKRYLLLSAAPLKIVQDTNTFSVYIPLIYGERLHKTNRI